MSHIGESCFLSFRMVVLSWEVWERRALMGAEPQYTGFMRHWRKRLLVCLILLCFGLVALLLAGCTTAVPKEVIRSQLDPDHRPADCYYETYSDLVGVCWPNGIFPDESAFGALYPYAAPVYVAEGHYDQSLRDLQSYSVTFHNNEASPYTKRLYFGMANNISESLEEYILGWKQVSIKCKYRNQDIFLTFDETLDEVFGEDGVIKEDAAHRRAIAFRFKEKNRIYFCGWVLYSCVKNADGTWPKIPASEAAEAYPKLVALLDIVLDKKGAPQSREALFPNAEDLIIEWMGS